VCERLSVPNNFKPDLSKPLLDFTYTVASDEEVEASSASGSSSRRHNDVTGDMRVIAPFVACGDLRYAAGSSLLFQFHVSYEVCETAGGMRT
jgi:tRNA (cytidine32/guanosine34-2'-O)-methyltransferase